MSNDKELKNKLIELMRSVIKQDNELREKFQIGDKFRFIRDRLKALSTSVETSLAELKLDEEIKSESAAEDETIIYVYLFNAQGLVLQTWQKMVNGNVFYEHSVNRPVYTEKSHVEAFIRGKTNKAQHGYLSIVIKKTDISQVAATEPVKDAIGNPLVKVREGTLQFKKLISFTHNGNEYRVNENGELIKKI